MKKNLCHGFAGLLLLTLGSCASTVNTDTLEGQHDAFNAIAPDYLNYVNNDPTMSIEQKAAKQALVDRWQQRLRELDREAR